jgi:hypothetical protein
LKRLVWLLAIAGLTQCKGRTPEPGPAPAPDPAPAASKTETRPLGSAVAPGSPGSTGPSALSSAVSRDIGGAARLDASPSDARATSSIDATSTARTVHFAVIGDYGSGTAAEAAVATMVKTWNPDFVITLGDNNYPAGEGTTIDANIGRYYADFIGNYRGRYGTGSKINRFWPSPGNHDWLSGLTPYTEYFTLPGNERYYDVEIGVVHLYALDSDAREPDGISPQSRQAGWLKDALAASKSCYDFVYFHHPAYSTAAHGSTRELRWPFRAWGAEAVFAGHDHTYERFVVDGIPYFVNGLGGESTYEFAGDPLPETRYRYNEQHGAMRVTATSSDVTYEFLTIDGQRHDVYTVPGNCR